MICFSIYYMYICGEQKNNAMEEELEDINFDFYEYEYSKATTNQLLITLHSVRAVISMNSDIEPDEHPNMQKLYKIYDALKDELATREHVPNKEQRKKIRQEKFKLKKT